MQDVQRFIQVCRDEIGRNTTEDLKRIMPSRLKPDQPAGGFEYGLIFEELYQRLGEEFVEFMKGWLIPYMNELPSVELDECLFNLLGIVDKAAEFTLIFALAELDARDAASNAPISET